MNIRNSQIVRLKIDDADSDYNNIMTSNEFTPGGPWVSEYYAFNFTTKTPFLPFIFLPFLTFYFYSYAFIFIF